jgi:hypothetical protein
VPVVFPVKITIEPEGVQCLFTSAPEHKFYII